MHAMHANSIDLRQRALPLIDIYYGWPTDSDIPVPATPQWVVECLSCWGDGDEPQHLGSFLTRGDAERKANLHLHGGRLGTGA